MVGVAVVVWVEVAVAVVVAVVVRGVVWVEVAVAVVVAVAVAVAVGVEVAVGVGVKGRRMTDEELVKSLRDFDETRDFIPPPTIQLDAADAIERLMREKDDLRSTLTDKIVAMRGTMERADAAERKVEKLREALKQVISYLEYSDAREHVLSAACAALAETENNDD